MTSLITSSCSAMIENLDECVKNIEAAGVKVSPLFCTQLDCSWLFFELYSNWIFSSEEKKKNNFLLAGAAVNWNSIVRKTFGWLGTFEKNVWNAHLQVTASYQVSNSSLPHGCTISPDKEVGQEGSFQAIFNDAHTSEACGSAKEVYNAEIMQQQKQQQDFWTLTYPRWP